MELSIIRLQEPTPDSVGERRRRIRHKLHTPAYVIFNGPNTGMAIDLNELLDLTEDGFAAQTSERLDANQLVSFSLDLIETELHIQSAGQVVWSDGDGRLGIRFSELSDGPKRQLKEWLFVNLLIARANFAARTKEVSQRAEKNPAAPQPIVHSLVSTSVADLSGLLSVVEAVRREIRGAGDDFEAALHLITERALGLTGASGVALALLTDSRMVCRASAGEPALPLGTPVNSKQGLSGECVSSGRMVTCADTEADARVDAEACRRLGIGSILASPILSDFRVVGLLEVFSPQVRAFAQVHETVLDRLAELVPKAQSAVLPSRDAPANSAISLADESAPPVNAIRETAWEPEMGSQEVLKGVPVRLAHLILLAMTLAVLALASGYLLAPRLEKLWRGKTAVAGPQAAATSGAAFVTSSMTPAARLASLRKRAEQGDPDAQWNLGASYRNGEGVTKDDVEAVRWYQRAANQGHVTAQSTLAASYWAGRGVPKDLTQAYFWSAVALHQGDRDSESRLRGLALQMTRAQLAAAQQQVDDWLRQHRASK